MYSYSEVGRKQLQLAWDKSQKGTVSIPCRFSDSKVMNWQIQAQKMATLSLVEYALVSLSLALIISKFFPVFHCKIVSKVSSIEHKSLYWGTVVVSNLCTYGLFFPIGRVVTAWAEINIIDGIPGRPTNVFFTFPCIQEIIIHIILLVAAVIASTNNQPGTDIPIPTGMAKVMINISFCFSCFCCYFCCSSRCRAKALRVLVLFSFMSFIYRSIMDTISVGFYLFVNVSETFIITVLYISLLFFLVLLVSYSIFSTIHARNTTIYRRSLNCCVGTCVLLIVFGAAMLMGFMYITIVLTLKPNGIKAVVAGLIPSIGLLAATWYMKKRLQRAQTQPNNPADYGATGESCDEMRDTRENADDADEQKMLLPR